MRILAWLSPLVFCSGTAFADACPDFKGKYDWSDEDGNYISLKIDQMACEKIVMAFEAFGFPFKDTHVLDGKKYLIQDDGDFQAYETAELIDGHVRIMEERVSTDDEDGSPHTYFVRKDIFLNGDNNLVDIQETLRADGAQTDYQKTTYKRLAD